MSVAYIYHKEGETIFYTSKQLDRLPTVPEDDGWKHTATVDLWLFMKYIINKSDEEILRCIKDLKL
jgi:hypothetical protein